METEKEKEDVMVGYTCILYNFYFELLGNFEAND